MQRKKSCRAAPAPWVVQQAQAAQLLLDPVERDTLRPFFGEGATISQAAKQLKLKPNTLLRKVHKLLELNLLEMVNEQRRAGRPMKLYRVRAEQFFVPFSETAAVTLEDLLLKAVEEPNRLISRALAQLYRDEATRLGYLVSALPSGRLIHDLSVEGQHPLETRNLPQPWYRDGTVVHLSPERAQAFVQELTELLGRYSPDKGEAHLAFMAFAPLRP